MAYMDAQLLFSDAQALTGTSAVASTNYVNLGTAYSYLGTGEPMAVAITVDVAAGGTSPTLTVAVQSDDNTSFSSAATVATTAAIAGATLVAGYEIVIPIPAGVSTEQYLRLSYIQGGTTPTITVTARLTPLRLLSNMHYVPNSYDV